MTGRPNRKTAETMYKKYGPDVYKKMGALGGVKSNTGGFYGRPDLAKAAGKRGWLVRKERLPTCECGVLMINKTTLKKHEWEGHKIT